jgi:DNA repair photolyase
MRAEYRLEPCRSALNPVRGMPFRWSLNPYLGCVHRCTFCYVHQSFLSTRGGGVETMDDVDSLQDLSPERLSALSGRMVVPLGQSFSTEYMRPAESGIECSASHCREGLESAATEVRAKRAPVLRIQHA